MRCISTSVLLLLLVLIGLSCLPTTVDAGSVVQVQHEHSTEQRQHVGISGHINEPPPGVPVTGGSSGGGYGLPRGWVACRQVSATSVQCGRTVFNGERLISPRHGAFWFYVACVVGLVLTAGLIAGLTLGLMSLDQTNLEIVKRSGKDSDREKAAKVLPLVKSHHLLLVTLLFINASANEALPLFLDNLVPPFVNIILSVTLVLLFGEIIPQAACSRHSLSVGAFFAPVVWVLIYITFPISWPIAKILDWVLGIDHGTFYHRAELKELVQMHTDFPSLDPEYGEGGLTRDECTIIRGALDMKQKTAGQCMTPIDKVEMVDFGSFLNRQSLQRLHDRGHSRIPVYMNTPDHVIGMLLTKHLIMINPDEGVAVRDLKLRPIPFVPSDKPLYDMLNLFQRGRSHMAIVVDTKDHLTLSGILTLEDVIEELIQEEITDETDLRLMAVAAAAAQTAGMSNNPSNPGANPNAPGAAVTLPVLKKLTLANNPSAQSPLNPHLAAITAGFPKDPSYNVMTPLLRGSTTYGAMGSNPGGIPARQRPPPASVSMNLSSLSGASSVGPAAATTMASQPTIPTSASFSDGVLTSKSPMVTVQNRSSSANWDGPASQTSPASVK